MQKNVENISTKSIPTDEIREQRAALKAAERKLAMKGQVLDGVRERISALRQQSLEKRRQHNEQGTATTKRALSTVLKRLESAVDQHDRQRSEYRELKQLVRDQQAVCRSLEKKENARQKAVAAFLKEWERRYDRNVRIREKNIRKRKRLDSS
jgi:hypothetical protein